MTVSSRSEGGDMNAVTHFEILGPDGPGLVDFYSHLFDWDLRISQLTGWPCYALLQAEGGNGISGAIGAADAAPTPRVIIYVEVEDPAASLSRAQELGASVVLPVAEIPETAGVVVAWFRYPQGNTVGLVKSRMGDA
jgi:predicted enzyme related to lactoylglutathione lyase